jgi:hypothetical protein
LFFAGKNFFDKLNLEVDSIYAEVFKRESSMRSEIFLWVFSSQILCYAIILCYCLGNQNSEENTLMGPKFEENLQNPTKIETSHVVIKKEKRKKK